MKHLLAIFGPLLFFVFTTGFTRLVVSLYHSAPFLLVGYDHYPADYWVIILLVTDTLFVWVSGMLTVTVSPSAPRRNLVLLGLLLILWRLNDGLFNGHDTDTWVVILLTGSVVLGITNSFLVHRNMTPVKDSQTDNS